GLRERHQRRPAGLRRPRPPPAAARPARRPGHAVQGEDGHRPRRDGGVLRRRRRAQAHRLRHPAGAQRRRPRLWAGQPRVRHAGALPAGGGRPHLLACYAKPVMAALDDLLDAVFGAERPAREDAFFEEFAGWARDSRRFRDFATEYSTKIRAKLRRAGDEEALADVRAELETAALLLGDRRFTLEYEKYAASR